MAVYETQYKGRALMVGVNLYVETDQVMQGPLEVKRRSEEYVKQYWRKIDEDETAMANIFLEHMFERGATQEAIKKIKPWVEFSKAQLKQIETARERIEGIANSYKPQKGRPKKETKMAKQNVTTTEPQTTAQEQSAPAEPKQVTDMSKLQHLSPERQKLVQMVNGRDFVASTCFLEKLLQVDKDGNCKLDEEAIFEEVRKEFPDTPEHHRYWYPDYYRGHFRKRGIQGIGEPTFAAGYDERKAKHKEEVVKPMTAAKNAVKKEERKAMKAQGAQTFGTVSYSGGMPTAEQVALAIQILAAAGPAMVQAYGMAQAVTAQVAQPIEEPTPAE